MADGIVEVSDRSFDSDVISSDKPVLVDFWAPWCGPCRAISPIIEELVSGYPGIKFTKCNVDENPVMPGKYEIKAIPTLIFFKKGIAVNQITGVVPKAKLENALTELLT